MSVAALLGLLACAKTVEHEPPSSTARGTPAAQPLDVGTSAVEGAPGAVEHDEPMLVEPAREAEPTPISRHEPVRRASKPTAGLHTVVRVVDGDTIQVDVGGSLERVRYIGIDTPETVHPRKPVECFGKEASARNEALVGGKKVRLERDVTDRDRYGRLLRYVYVGDVFVNLELVREGYAKVSTYPPDVEHTDALVAAQRDAREANRGLWSGCEVEVDPEPEPPKATPPAKGCDIKGNINARGDKIYHDPGCPSYTRTKIDPSAGERWFCSNAEAESAGWRRAGNCP